ncbi:MAG: acyl carrier protein, partial [Hyphomicrobiaceae bacterium]
MSNKPATEPAAGGLQQDTATEQLLHIVRELAIELHPETANTLAVTLDSELDRDLGLDSLGRAELMLRLDRAFHVQLPEALFAEAKTAGDLLTAVLTSEVKTDAAPAAARPAAMKST